MTPTVITVCSNKCTYVCVHQRKSCIPYREKKAKLFAVLLTFFKSLSTTYQHTLSSMDPPKYEYVCLYCRYFAVWVGRIWLPLGQWALSLPPFLPRYPTEHFTIFTVTKTPISALGIKKVADRRFFATLKVLNVRRGPFRVKEKKKLNHACLMWSLCGCSALQIYAAWVPCVLGY